jgi:hypothetical protein
MLTAEERQRVESFAHRSRSAAALARRARIILACAEGTDSKFIDAHQADPRPFVWTKSADEILASIARFAQRTVDARAAQSMSRTTVTGH